ncbi:MAG TPA: TetR/AcrR family transcriptional regulator [Solirubrobacterales bacterium]
MAADQRERLLAAVPVVVAEYGFSATTVAHIVGAAGVGRATFYEQFTDKLECFEVAYERAQDRLLGALTFPCYVKSSLGERIEGALSAALELLAREPDLAVLVAVEGPGAGPGPAKRHLQGMRRYGALLPLGVLGVPGAKRPPAATEVMIAGGIVTAIAQRVLAGEVERLPSLAPSLAEYALSFYG